MAFVIEIVGLETFILSRMDIFTKSYSYISNISNPTIRTGLDFKSALVDEVRGEDEDWIKLRGLEI